MSQDLSKKRVELEALPEELLDDVIARLSRVEQCRVARISRSFYHSAVSHIYSTVHLSDCFGPDDNGDDHDDTPIVKVLKTLSGNPYLASKVQTLSHSCHLPPPDVFTMLDVLSLKGPLNEFHFPGLHLLRLAVVNMINVHTLRIIFGHHHISTALVREFFSSERRNASPIKRLWIETSSLEDIAFSDARDVFANLESLRLRRLSLCPETNPTHAHRALILTRGGIRVPMKTTLRGVLSTTILRPSELPTLSMSENVKKWNQDAHRRLFHPHEILEDDRHLPPAHCCVPEETVQHGVDPCGLILTILHASSITLVSLNLDWITCFRDILGSFWANLPIFPNLRSLQLRNGVLKASKLDAEAQLFNPGSVFFAFLKQHTQLESLAWPIEHFFPSSREDEMIERTEVRDVINQMSRTLTHLRIDARIAPNGEPDTDLSAVISTTNNNHGFTPESQDRRKRFIDWFAAEMRALESLKIEGGIPRDETRAIISAVGRCPLKKLVIIGICWPLGDSKSPNEIVISPVLHEVAAKFPHSIEELKFCGFKGSPILDWPHNMTAFADVVAPLRQMVKLRTLTMALSLDKMFEQRSQDEEILEFWNNSQSASSTALTLAADTTETSPWGKILQEKFRPTSLVDMLYSNLKPHLCPSRTDELRIKGLFLMEVPNASEIFDFGVTVQPDGSIEKSWGPRDENDEEKVEGKLASREWF
ncbi:MAG: hypothetical protein M1837_000803 [Sclerophora amabilis]|nr:MAG: hypothetical protein M1837_000803 [Sclerophora amabilis]